MVLCVLMGIAVIYFLVQIDYIEYNTCLIMQHYSGENFR